MQLLVFNCLICNSDIGLLADVANHFCFEGYVASVSSDGYAFIDEQAQSTSTKAACLNWPKETVLKLIETWKLKSSNKFIKAKVMWQNIACELATKDFNPTWEQVENKWKGLRRTHKKIRDNNNASGLHFHYFFSPEIKLQFH